MNIPMIVSLSGKKGSGKNTAADYLTKIYGYKQIAWADALRDEVISAIRLRDIEDITKTKYRVYPDFINSLITEVYNDWLQSFKRNTIYNYVYTKPTPPALRKLLQQWGTEFRRAQDPAYWLKKLHLEPGQKYVITDTRFQNEVDLLTVFGSLNIMINAYGFPEKEADAHASEKLELTKMDYEVANEYGNIVYLFNQLDSIVRNVENKTIERVSFVDWDENASK